MLKKKNKKKIDLKKAKIVSDIGFINETEMNLHFHLIYKDKALQIVVTED